jgi:serine/threonine protein kinase
LLRRDFLPAHQDARGAEDLPVIARDKLLEDLRRSGLVDEERLSRFLDDQEADAESLLRQLVEAGLLTQWQSEGVLAGKWRGYFLGKYKLLQPLGMGAMGSVFLAEHKVMRHRVAIKVLARHLLTTPNIVDRFEREARAAAVIHHPNVVRAYDVDSEGDIHFLVMEYVQGEDLRKLVEKNGTLDPRVAAEYVQQVARGLDVAHRNGLIHRDIKPANLLRDQTGLIKILDLGLARLEDEAASVTQMNDVQVLGTVDYLAPEQARDSHNIDGRADLYSLGCTLYFLLTGVPPFPKGSAAERMLKHQTRRPLDIRKRRPGVPDALVNICSRLMEKMPDKRFATAGDAATALGEFLEGRYQTVADDDLLTFAEDADGGSGISRKTGQSSVLGRRLGGSSTAAGASLENTVTDKLELVPDTAASKSLLKPAEPAPPAPEEAKPAVELDFGLAPLGSSPSLSVFDQLPPAPATSASGSGQNPLAPLPTPADPFSSLGPLAGNPLEMSGPASASLSGPLGPALSPAQPSKPPERKPSEVQYPLWALLGVGLLLGLLVVGVGYLVYSAMQ